MRMLAAELLRRHYDTEFRRVAPQAELVFGDLIISPCVGGG
jgi:hypothetical protein